MLDLAMQQCGVLSLGTCFLFAKVIAFFPFAHTKALVPILHCLDDLLGCQLVAQLLRQSVCACPICREEAATRNPGYSRTARRLEKIPAAQTIAERQVLDCSKVFGPTQNNHRS
jgi:hypothetical protein